MSHIPTVSYRLSTAWLSCKSYAVYGGGGVSLVVFLPYFKPRSPYSRLQRHRTAGGLINQSRHDCGPGTRVGPRARTTHSKSRHFN